MSYCYSKVALIDSQCTNVGIESVFADVEFRGSWIGGLQIGNFFGAIRLDDTHWEVGLEIENSIAEISGNYTVGDDARAIINQSSVGRRFTVLVLDSDGTPVEAASVQTSGPGAREGTYQTDERGVASFGASFDSSSDDLPIRILVRFASGETVERSISVLSPDELIIRQP